MNFLGVLMSTSMKGVKFSTFNATLHSFRCFLLLVFFFGEDLPDPKWELFQIIRIQLSLSHVRTKTQLSRMCWLVPILFNNSV